MKGLLSPLLHVQRLFVPALVLLVVWAVWRTARRKDGAVGLALYLGLVIFADGFFNTGIYLPGLEKGSIRYSEFCAIFLLAAPRPSGDRVRWRTFSLLVATYFVLLFASALRSSSVVAGVFEFRGLIVPQIVAFAVARRGLKTKDDYRRFVLHLATIVLVVGLFDLWDIVFDRWLLHSDSLFTGKYFMNRTHGRYGSVFLNPNMLGAFMVLVFPALFIWTMSEPVRWRRYYGWSALLALAFCVVETQSRGPMLALAGAVPLLSIGPCGGVSRRRRLGFLALFLVLFATFMPGFLDHATERFAEIDKEMTTDDARTRQTVWLYARRMIADHPVIGIGFGEKQFLATIDTYGFRDRYDEAPLDNPHNSYLQMTVYAGLPALVSFVLANLALLWRAGRITVDNASDSSPQIVFGFAIGVAGFLASAYPDMHLFTRDVGPAYWLGCGLLVSLVAQKGSSSARAAATTPTFHALSSELGLARRRPTPAPRRATRPSIVGQKSSPGQSSSPSSALLVAQRPSAGRKQALS